jgi:hypothetical protein
MKCICTSTDDGGSTVLCEKRETWQHIACYFPDGIIPDEHHCTDYSPRYIDAEAASERRRHGSKAGKPRSVVKASTSGGSSKRHTEDVVSCESLTIYQNAAHSQEGSQRATDESKDHHEAFEEQFKEIEDLRKEHMAGLHQAFSGPNCTTLIKNLSYSRNSETQTRRLGGI